MPEILDSLSPEDVYLCQSESIHQLDPDQLKMFHVKPIQDEFSESGLRRNKLYKVTRIA